MNDPPDVCVPDEDAFVSQRIPDPEAGTSPLSKRRGWRTRGGAEPKEASSKGNSINFIIHQSSSLLLEQQGLQCEHVIVRMTLVFKA